MSDPIKAIGYRTHLFALGRELGRELREAGYDHETCAELADYYRRGVANGAKSVDLERTHDRWRRDDVD